MDVPSNLAHGRGRHISQNCGGFHPVRIHQILRRHCLTFSQRVPMENWTPNSLCVCSQSWLAHMNIAMYVSPSVRAETVLILFTFPSIPNVGMHSLNRAQPATIQLASQQQFVPLQLSQPLLLARTTNDRRLAAAQRTLPHHQTSAPRGRRGSSRRGGGFGSRHHGGRGSSGYRIPDEFSVLPNTDFLAVCLPFTVRWNVLSSLCLLPL
jgi:hypothetical protein